jgi:hypothetical protein
VQIARKRAANNSNGANNANDPNDTNDAHQESDLQGRMNK